MRSLVTAALAMTLAIEASALPPTAKLVDGNEDAGYHGETEKRDFAVQTAYQLVGVMPLIAPENRGKYRMQVGVHQPKGETAHYANVRIVKVK